MPALETGMPCIYRTGLLPVFAGLQSNCTNAKELPLKSGLHFDPRREPLANAIQHHEKQEILSESLDAPKKQVRKSAPACWLGSRKRNVRWDAVVQGDFARALAGMARKDRESQTFLSMDYGDGAGRLGR